MAIRRWLLASLVGGLLVVGGCGDDGDGDTPRAGTGSPKAGNGGSTKLTPDMAIAGACTMREDLTMCTGIDKFTTCTLTTCGLQPCLDNACKDYLMCLERASDPCMNNCQRSSACSTCIEDIPQCVINMCAAELGDCPN
jgi:hypothetical protein